MIVDLGQHSRTLHPILFRLYCSYSISVFEARNNKDKNRHPPTNPSSLPTNKPRHCLPRNRARISTLHLFIFGFPPYLLHFFTNPQIQAMGGVLLLKSAYLLGTFAVIFGLPLFSLSDPTSRRMVTLIGVGKRAVVILVGVESFGNSSLWNDGSGRDKKC